MIELTERAVEQFSNKIRDSLLGKIFRIKLKKGGCNGYEYIIDYADSVQDDDTSINFDNFNIIMDPESMPYIEGSSLDYVTEGLNSQFKFVNPNVVYTCGCGVSVNFE